MNDSLTIIGISSNGTTNLCSNAYSSNTSPSDEYILVELSGK